MVRLCYYIFHASLLQNIYAMYLCSTEFDNLNKLDSFITR